MPDCAFLSMQHVLDCTAPNLNEHRAAVLQVLQQVGVSEEKLKNMIEVWNKVLQHIFHSPIKIYEREKRIY